LTLRKAIDFRNWRGPVKVQDRNYNTLRGLGHAPMQRAIAFRPLVEHRSHARDRNSTPISWDYYIWLLKLKEKHKKVANGINYDVLEPFGGRYLQEGFNEEVFTEPILPVEEDPQSVKAARESHAIALLAMVSLNAHTK
jgi:hypothetical protein